RLPEGDRLLGPAPFLARERAEQRVVPEGQCARPRVAGEIRGEPLLLRRPEAAAPRYVVAIGVQRDNVPRADLEAVVAAPHPVARPALHYAGAGEVVEVPGGAWCRVLVASGHRAPQRPEPPPGRGDRASEAREAAVGVLL